MEEVLPVIAPVTHADRKAPRLIEAVRRIGRLRGAVTLDFLQAWPLDDAMTWLQELPGAGHGFDLIDGERAGVMAHATSLFLNQIYRAKARVAKEVI